MYLTPAKKFQVLRFLRISRSHLEKVVTMVESDQQCFRVIHRTRVVRKALRKVDRVLLDEYLLRCLGSDVSKEELQQEIQRMVSALKKVEG